MYTICVRRGRQKPRRMWWRDFIYHHDPQRMFNRCALQADPEGYDVVGYQFSLYRLLHPLL